MILIIPGGQPDFSASGPLLGTLVNLVILALLYLPAILIGMLCRQWQGAVALNVAAIIPGFLIYLIAFGGRGFGYGLNGLGIV
ncbi:MAG: hypothetical protein ACRDID_21710, partial [Ktedonobacterales bacterium]